MGTDFLIFGIVVMAIVAIMEVIKSIWTTMPRWFKLIMPIILGGISGFFFPFSFIIHAGYGIIETVVFTSVVYASFSSYSYQFLKNALKSTLEKFLKNIFNKNDNEETKEENNTIRSD